MIQGLKPFESASARRTRYPDVKFLVNFYRQDGSVISTSVASNQSISGRATDDLVRVETHKDLRNPAGGYMVTLVPRQDYLNLLVPGDWCEIKSNNGDGKGDRILMYGPISDVRQRRTVDQKTGNINRLVTVTGADFGKAIVGTTALFDAKLAEDSGFSNLGWVANVIKELRAVVGDPGTMLRAFITRFYLFGLSTGQPGLEQWVDPKTGSTFGFVGMTLDYIEDDLLGKAAFQPIILSSSLWQLLQQWSNAPLNELFMDYRPPKDNTSDLINLVPAIVLRQHPFWGTAWDNLISVSVDSTEVIDDDLGRSDSDVRNWIRVGDEPSLTGNRNGLSVYLDNIGTSNTESIKRFGIQRYEPYSQYILDPDSEEPRSIPGLLEEINGLAALWHHSNEYLFSGTQLLYHNPDIRIGYRYDFTDLQTDVIMQYYVESVRHSYMFPGRSTTSVTLTRGQDVNDPRFLYDLETLKSKGILQELGTTIQRAAPALRTL